MKNSKFIPLYETIYNRYSQGHGFLEGDLVKLKSSYKSTEAYKSLNDTLKNRVETAETSGYNIRLGRLHTPNNSAGSLGINPNLPATHADVYLEMSPGNFGGLMTVPIDLFEQIDTGVNLSPVSANNKRTSGQYQKAGKWKSNSDTPATKDQNHLGHEENWVKKGDYELAEKNKKPSVGTNDYDDTKPSTNYKPLPKNKLKPATLKESEKILESLYINILNEDVGMAGSGAESSYEEEHNEEEICPVCGREVCGCTHKQLLDSGKLHIKPHHVKDECWNTEENKVVDECWGEDGNIKEECWRMEEESAEGMPGNDGVNLNTGQESGTIEDGPM
jgi:hypothetical protein